MKYLEIVLLLPLYYTCILLPLSILVIYELYINISHLDAVRSESFWHPHVRNKVLTFHRKQFGDTGESETRSR